MTQAPALETMQLQIVSCETCDALFLVSPRRQSCPACGGPAGVEFFTFDVGPNGVQQIAAFSLAGIDLAHTGAEPASPPTGVGEIPEVPGETFEFGAHCPACDVALQVSLTDDACVVELVDAQPADPDVTPEKLTTPEPVAETS